jgi:acetolactate synthase-1/2/3 large subunit
MDWPFDRRTLFRGAALVGGMALAAHSSTQAIVGPKKRGNGWIEGKMTGAMAVAEALLQEGVECVYGIPGAQENELWDAFKSKGVPYLLTTHEFSASCMADAYARTKGRAGVCCVVPGPGLTNSLSGLGEALIDSVPIVAIIGDIAQGEKFRPFQVHCLDQVALLKPVTKGVFQVKEPSQIAAAIRAAFALAEGGEPGPVGVVIPYTMLIDQHDYRTAPTEGLPVPFDDTNFEKALRMLVNKRHKIGIYAGQGCMAFSEQLTRLAEVLQAPVATSVSGKGVISDRHPLAVGWGYGPHATHAAEKIFTGGKLPFGGVDVVLAIGVRYSEVSTGYYANPKRKHLIHVDINPANLGKAVEADICVNADAGLFLSKALEFTPALKREPDEKLVECIRLARAEDQKKYQEVISKVGIDPMIFLLSLRKCLPDDALVFVDVTVTEHLAAEAFQVYQPRTYFNPTDNQSMGWSIPAAIGAQKVNIGKPVVSIVGDGCFLMSAIELSTAARENLPVKFFILDDQAYHYMQMLQKAAYLRTTATILARLDYPNLAKGLGVGYMEIDANHKLEAGIKNAMEFPGPVLVRLITDYQDRKIRWIEAVRRRYIRELTPAQQMRFLSRIGSRAIEFERGND